MPNPCHKESANRFSSYWESAKSVRPCIMFQLHTGNMFSCPYHVRVICSMSMVEMIVSSLKDIRHILKYLLFLSTWSFACSSQRNPFQHFWSLVGTNKKTFLFTRLGRGWVSITDLNLCLRSQLTFIPICWYRISYSLFIVNAAHAAFFRIGVW